MKVRTDFVTNSSSSSFIIAREEELSEHLKEVMVEFVQDEMLGKKILSPDSTEDEISEFLNDYGYDEYAEEIHKVLEEGKSIYMNRINFECADYNYADLFERLLDRMSSSEREFKVIDGDLSY